MNILNRLIQTGEQIFLERQGSKEDKSIKLKINKDGNVEVEWVTPLSYRFIKELFGVMMNPFCG